MAGVFHKRGFIEMKRFGASLSKLSILKASIFGLLALSTVLPAPRGVLAATEQPGPAKDIREIFEQVRKTATENQGKLTDAELEEKLKEIILPVFNFDEMSRRCLGSNWSAATPDQQNEFVTLFSDLLARTYLARIRRNAVTSTIKSMSETVQDGKALVRTKVDAEGTEVSIDYKMQKTPERWRIYDIIVENIGLVNNYRSEFSSIVRQKGFPTLLEKLREKRLQAPQIPKEIDEKLK